MSEYNKGNIQSIYIAFGDGQFLELQEKCANNFWENAAIFGGKIAFAKYIKPYLTRRHRGESIEGIYVRTKEGELLKLVTEGGWKNDLSSKEPYQPLWSYKWIAKPIGYLLTREEREEWFGDLLEIKERMVIEDRYPLRVINLVVSVKAGLLIWSKVKCEFIEIVSKIVS